MFRIQLSLLVLVVFAQIGCEQGTPKPPYSETPWQRISYDLRAAECRQGCLVLYYDRYQSAFRPVFIPGATLATLRADMQASNQSLPQPDTAPPNDPEPG